MSGKILLFFVLSIQICLGQVRWLMGDLPSTISVGNVLEFSGFYEDVTGVAYPITTYMTYVLPVTNDIGQVEYIRQSVRNIGEDKVIHRLSETSWAIGHVPALNFVEFHWNVEGFPGEVPADAVGMKTIYVTPKYLSIPDTLSAEGPFEIYAEEYYQYSLNFTDIRILDSGYSNEDMCVLPERREEVWTSLLNVTCDGAYASEYAHLKGGYVDSVYWEPISREVIWSVSPSQIASIRGGATLCSQH